MLGRGGVNEMLSGVPNAPIMIEEEVEEEVETLAGRGAGAGKDDDCATPGGCFLTSDRWYAYHPHTFFAKLTLRNSRIVPSLWHTSQRNIASAAQPRR